MIPEASGLIVGHYDEHTRPLRALFKCFKQGGHVLLALQESRLTRMAIVASQRLIERHRGEPPAHNRRLEIFAIQKMALTILGAIPVALEIGIGLMMELKGRIGSAPSGIIPTGRIPSPVNMPIRQSVTQGGLSLGCEHPVGAFCLQIAGTKSRKDIVDRETILGEGPIASDPTVCCTMNLIRAGRVGLPWCAGTGHPHVIEEGSTKGRRKKMIEKGIALCIGPQRKC